MRTAAVRLAQLVPVLFVVTLASFMLVQLLPGDTAVAILGPSATPDAITQLEHDLRLDEPLVTQYVSWVGDLAGGDFGHSYRTRQPVADLLTDRLPATLELVVLSQLLALAVAIPLGTIAALRPGRWLDQVLSGTSLGLLAAPAYVLGVVTVYVFAVQLQWLPATGWVPLTEDPVSNLRHAILPTVTLSLGLIAIYMRILRAEMVSTLQQNYILVANAKGLPVWRVLVRHALRPSTFPLITVLGLTIGSLLGGTILVETIFHVPGLGQLTVNAITGHDYLVVQGVVVVVAVGYVLVNLAVDLLYTVIDPTVRNTRARRAR